MGDDRGQDNVIMPTKSKHPKRTDPLLGRASMGQVREETKSKISATGL